MNDATTILRWLPMASAVLQLVGTALIVWGLKVTTDTGVSRLLLESSADPLPSAGIVHERPWAVTWGVRLLLLGLLLAVAVALL